MVYIISPFIFLVKYGNTDNGKFSEKYMVATLYKTMIDFLKVYVYRQYKQYHQM